MNICFFYFIGLDLKKIERCMGDPNADSDNPLLKEEQDAQVIFFLHKGRLYKIVK